MCNYNLLKLIRHVRNVYHIARAFESAFSAANQTNRIVESSNPQFIYTYILRFIKEQALDYTNVELLCNFPCVNLPFVQIQCSINFV